MEPQNPSSYSAFDLVLRVVTALLLVLSAFWCFLASQSVVRMHAMFQEMGVDTALPTITRIAYGVSRTFVAPLVSVVVMLAGVGLLIGIRDRVRGVLGAFVLAVLNSLMGLVLFVSFYAVLARVITSFGE